MKMFRNIKKIRLIYEGILFIFCRTMFILNWPINLRYIKNFNMTDLWLRIQVGGVKV